MRLLGASLFFFFLRRPTDPNREASLPQPPTQNFAIRLLTSQPTNQPTHPATYPSSSKQPSMHAGRQPTHQPPLSRSGPGGSTGFAGGLLCPAPHSHCRVGHRAQRAPLQLHRREPGEPTEILELPHRALVGNMICFFALDWLSPNLSLANPGIFREPHFEHQKEHDGLPSAVATGIQWIVL